MLAEKLCTVARAKPGHALVEVASPVTAKLTAPFVKKTPESAVANPFVSKDDESITQLFELREFEEKSSVNRTVGMVVTAAWTSFATQRPVALVVRVNVAVPMAAGFSAID